MSSSTGTIRRMRAGILRVNRNMAVNRPSIVARVFRGIRFTPIQCTVDVMADVITYSGFSPLFEKLEQYCVLPEYTVLFRREKGKPTKFELTKGPPEHLPTPSEKP